MKYMLMLHTGESQEITAENDEAAIEEGKKFSEQCCETVNVVRCIAICEGDRAYKE